MTDSVLYHEGNRLLQDSFDTRRIADRLEESRMHVRFSESDRDIIGNAPCFFLATANAAGEPDCSYKGGVPGFVHIVDDDTLAFPDYDGNGMFKSLGNILVNPAVGLLFVEFGGECRRLRVNGTATIGREDPLKADMPGAQLVVRVRARQIFPNCPRYIHRQEAAEPSVYCPRPGYEPPEPFWKSKPDLRDYLPRRQPEEVEATVEAEETLAEPA